MFSGTVRENLDPRGLHEDRALWQALEQCHLSEAIMSLGEYWVLPGGGGKEQGGSRERPGTKDAVPCRWFGW